MREKLFHDDRFGGDDHNRKTVQKYYSLMDNARKQFDSMAIRACRGKRLLEFGCGTGSPETWENRKAIVTGIDISEEGVKKANQKALEKGLQARYYVMNAEKTNFQNHSFNIIVGSGILHHLNLENVYFELNRLLDKKGSAIFIEPLGHNPIFVLYRKLTPSLRTRDEHPLKTKDIELAHKYFQNVELSYFNLLTFLAVPFRKTKYFPKLLFLLERLDGSLMNWFPYIKKYAWVVVINLSFPKTKPTDNK